jgi:glycosyltransferase involved in cell wall biosynthesis
MYKLTIITINYNNLVGLQRTIESVVKQTWQEFEYIVIDGGSTDGSAEYIKSKNANIDYWVSEPDAGIYNAMNKGIAKATGDYLLFLNSGDHFYNEEVLENNNKYLKDKDLIFFNLLTIGDKFSELINYPEQLRFYDLYFGSLPHPATFIRKEIFKTTGMYDENLKIVSDWKFFILALFRDNCTYQKVNDTFSTFYLDGISSREVFTEERALVLKEYFSGFILDYSEINVDRNELKRYREILESKRYKIFFEIEKSLIGRKLLTVFFRIWIFLYSSKTMKY